MSEWAAQQQPASARRSELNEDRRAKMIVARVTHHARQLPPGHLALDREGNESPVAHRWDVVFENTTAGCLRTMTLSTQGPEQQYRVGQTIELSWRCVT